MCACVRVPRRAALEAQERRVGDLAGECASLQARLCEQAEAAEDRSEEARLREDLQRAQVSAGVLKEQCDRWAAQAKALGAELEGLTHTNEETGEALCAAQETIRLQQALVGESEQREESLRTEVMELRGQVRALQVAARTHTVTRTRTHTHAVTHTHTHTCPWMRAM